VLRSLLDSFSSEDDVVVEDGGSPETFPRLLLVHF
jgi:hypothetical protein